MNFHLGQPKHDGALRFFHGTIHAKGYKDQDCYFEHPIKWWLGISFGRTFIGIVKTDRTRNVRQAAR